MANNLNDILIAQFRKAFTLSDFGTSFVQQVFYLGYFLLAVPALDGDASLRLQGRDRAGADALWYGRAALLSGGGGEVCTSCSCLACS